MGVREKEKGETGKKIGQRERRRKEKNIETE
jgi:hypothetical protein